MIYALRTELARSARRDSPADILVIAHLLPTPAFVRPALFLFFLLGKFAPLRTRQLSLFTWTFILVCVTALFTALSDVAGATFRSIVVG